MSCIGGTHYFTWSGGTTGNDPGPSLYCRCGSVKRGDADMMRIIAAQLAERDQQIAALREGLVQAETALLAYRFPAGENAEQLSRRAGDAITKARALLATPAAEPDDEIRMPIHPGIPGVGVVVSAGPRPELVIERDVSSIDCERCGRYIELDEHEGDLCNDCRATMTAGEEAT